MMRSKKPHDSMFPKNTWDTRECKLEYTPTCKEKNKQHVNIPKERVGGTLDTAQKMKHLQMGNKSEMNCTPWETKMTRRNNPK